MSKVQGYRTTIQPRRPPPAPKGREEKGIDKAPSSPSTTPPLREKGVSTYIGSLADHYRFHLHSTIGPHMVPIVE